MNTPCKMMTLQWKLMEFESKTCLLGPVAHVSFNLTRFSARGQETWSLSPHLLPVACIPETKSWWQDRHVSRRGVHWCVTVSWNPKHSFRDQPKDALVSSKRILRRLHFENRMYLVCVNVSGTCHIDVESKCDIIPLRLLFVLRTLGTRKCDNGGFNMVQQKKKQKACINGLQLILTRTYK